MLSRAHSTSVLVALLDVDETSGTRLAHAIGPVDVQTTIRVARWLADARLVTVDAVPGPFPGQDVLKISLTPEGRAIAEDLRRAASKFDALDVPEPEVRLPPGIPRARPYVEGDFKRRHGLPTKYRDDDSGEPPGEDRQE